MAPDAGGPSMGGRAEQQGTKGYGNEDSRDGHNEEPDVIVAPSEDGDAEGAPTTTETTEVRDPAGGS